MKVTYEANDGTKFDSEFECFQYEQQTSDLEDNKWDELHDLVEKKFSARSYVAYTTTLTDFIFNNKEEIAKILGFTSDSEELTFTNVDGEVFKAVPDSGGCDGCMFKKVKRDCDASESVSVCWADKIIWIKK